MQGYGRTAAAGLLCTGLLTTGCGVFTSSESASSSSSSKASPHPPGTSGATPRTSSPTSPATASHTSASAAAPSAPASQSSVPPSTTSSAEPNSAPSRAGHAQIPAERLPGFNAAWRWTSTDGLGSDLSPCLLTTLVSIGAVREAGHTYRSATARQTDQAAQLTGVFPDEHTALSAQAVLTAWHDKCAERAKQLGLKHVNVSETRDVATPVGAASQWMLTYGPVAGEPNTRWFVSQGFVRDGDTITVLIYRSAGQDYNYLPGQEPVDRGLEVAGTYLRSTR